jgi:hypothetical protein
MKKKLLIVFLTAFFIIVNFVVVASFQQQQNVKSQAAPVVSFPSPAKTLIAQNMPTAVPTFTCLGSCPISPTEPAPQTPANPTPCPDTQINSQSTDDDIQANHRRGGKKGDNRDGLLQILIKLLELIIQLLGGGTPAPSEPSDPGPKPDPAPSDPSGEENPPPSNNPCASNPTEKPEPTEAPEPTQGPAATQAPAATTAPVGGALVCGKKTTPPASTQTVSCSGLTATQPTSNGYYESTNFGCNIGFPKDPVDNCIPACSGTPECAGLSGRQCEEKVIWYSANADQYGCNTKLKVTNPVNGKAVIVRALDRGPGCAIQRNRSVFDISQAAYKEIGVQKFVHVEKVPESTPLGPIPVCTQ